VAEPEIEMGKTKQNPRYNVISCRVADDELAQLNAAVLSVKRGTFIREAVMEKIEREKGREA
jgi:hypothetical protein